MDIKKVKESKYSLACFFCIIGKTVIHEGVKRE